MIPKTQGWQYAQDVVSGKIKTNRYVKLQCKQSIQDYKKQSKKNFKWCWNPNKAKLFMLFIQCTSHVKGEKALKPFKPEPWQAYIFEQIFGWVSKDNSDKLRFVEIVLLIARKNGKSFMLSGIALFKILFGDHGEEIYSLATKKDQAKIVWETAVNQSQVMDKSFKRLLKSTTTRLSNQSKMAFYAFVGKDSTTLDGLNPSTTIIDEASMISDRNLIEVFESAIGARLSPQIIYISTASFSRDTFFLQNL